MLQKLSLLFFLFVANYSVAQETCDLIFTGKVIDNHDDQPLVGATVKFANKTTITNADGVFSFTKLCKAEETLIIQHIFCEDYISSISLESSLTKTFYLEHHEELLEEIEIEAKAKRGEQAKASKTIEVDEVSNFSTQTLGELLENTPGITLLKTGATISKPVINGLHSQRILMINQGMRMEGQQWGLEHAPEIDPNAVQLLSVIQGPGSVEYGADAVGGVIIVESGVLPDTYGIRIKPTITAFSNGRGGSTSLDIIGKQRVFNLPISFQAQGSLKKAGNLKAPNYYLDNTGVEEANFMLRAGYIGDQFGIEGKISQFNNQLGILTDSHIGNERDLLAIIENGQPFLDRGFSYDINRPRQEILHEIVQLKSYYKTGVGELQFNLSRQYNRRAEFDRSDDDPGLRLKTETFSQEINLKHQLSKNINGKAGIQLQQQDYRFDGFYLIPEYQQNSFGAYIYEALNVSDKLTAEASIRYDVKDYTYFLPVNDFTFIDVETIPYQTVTENIGELNTTFDDLYTGSFGFSYTPKESLLLSAYLGYGSRQPLPNELFSDGLHHGTALWEVGNPNLQVERATNLQLNGDYQKNNLSASVNFYSNQINNYAYLIPDQGLDPFTTIRGVFPVYQTRQTDAHLFGVNYELKHNFDQQNLELSTSGNILNATDKLIDQPLLLMPANRLNHQAKYMASKKISVQLSIQNVFEQKRIPDETILKDFVSPPEAYNLVNASFGYNTKIKNTNDLSLQLGVENLLNTEYKDYLDRFRYFAHSPGINFGMSASYNFSTN